MCATEEATELSRSTDTVRRKARRYLPLLIVQQHGLCAYCGRCFDITPELVPTVDHVRPLSHGGASNPGNLVASCYACNYAKGIMTFEAYMRHLWDTGQRPLTEDRVGQKLPVLGKI